MPGRVPIRPRDAFRAMTRSGSHVEREAGWLILLSLADLVVTYRLLWQGAQFYESNPVARWFFVRWNIAGMSAYKFAMVGLIVALGEVIERHRPGWGRTVVALGAVAAAAVAAHGVRLLLRHG